MWGARGLPPIYPPLNDLEPKKGNAGPKTSTKLVGRLSDQQGYVQACLSRPIHVLRLRSPKSIGEPSLIEPSGGSAGMLLAPVILGLGKLNWPSMGIHPTTPLFPPPLSCLNSL